MNIQFSLDGKVRDKPVADDYLSALDEVLKATDPRLGARIVSAGQAPKGSGGKRTGSTRHDVDHTGHSHTSDLVLTLDGKEIRPGDDKDLYAKFLRNAAPKFPGIGHYDWGVHIGDGAAAMWGPDKTSKSIDPIFAKAISEGRSGTNMPAPRKKVTDPAVLAKLNGSAKRKKVTDPSVLAKLNGAPASETGQPAGVPEFKPVGVEGYNPKTGEVENTGVVDKLGAFLSSAIEGVPIAGPTLKKAATGTAAGIVSTIEGKDFGDVYGDMESNTADLERDNPITATAGYLTGAIAPMVGVGATAMGGKLLGSAGNSLGTRTLLSGASNALVAAGDTAARGGSDADVAKNTMISGAIGLAIPAAGAVINSMGRYAKDTIAPRLNAITRPSYEAERRVGAALARDADNTAAPLLNQTDEAAAGLNQQQLLNVDRGGETTRALARSAANADPEARALIEKTASDRFGSQGDRARSFIDRITGGATDDLAVQEGLKNAARQVNKPAYDRAFSATAAQDMSSPELMNMLKSPAMRQAAAAAEKRGADRAVVEGFDTVRNPFVFDDAGNVAMKEGVKPTLQFWNQVKINLDGEIGKAQRAGDNALARDLTGLKTQLVSQLDSAVPEYATARQGAAAFFGAEDALDAGKKFVTMNRSNAEVEAALKKMKPAEQTAFAVGFASELKDAIAQAGDRTNVINKIFGSQQSRDKIALALGPKAFGEFEQFVKVENSMDMIRRAMGNSTTARQLMEMGLAGTAIGGGTALYTGDWTQGLTVGVLAGLAKRYGGKVDERVTKRVAELLLSDNPQALKQAVTLAKNSAKASAALDAIQTALSAALKGAGNAALRPERKPLEITVTQPNGVEAAP